jgi:hypothetical protein
VRVAACGALAAFARSLPPGGYDTANAGYLAAGLAIHMDDGDTAVAAAAASALKALAAAAPGPVAAEVAKALPRMRARHLAEGVLAAAGGSGGGAPGPGA